jgi:hypothetical protein
VDAQFAREVVLITRIAICKLMQRITKSYDCIIDGTAYSWAELLIEKASIPLMQDMLEHGQIDPIMIDITHEGWELGNGHHRLACAILLGWDTIECAINDAGKGWAESGMITEGYIENDAEDGDILAKALVDGIYETMRDLKEREYDLD